jgi:hypothetical protein
MAELPPSLPAPSPVSLELLELPKSPNPFVKKHTAMTATMNSNPHPELDIIIMAGALSDMLMQYRCNRATKIIST